MLIAFLSLEYLSSASRLSEETGAVNKILIMSPVSTEENVTVGEYNDYNFMLCLPSSLVGEKAAVCI